MNDTRFNKALEQIRKIRMTTDEKAALRERVFSAAGGMLQPDRKPVRSPWSIYSFSSWVIRHRAVSISVAAVLIVVLAGGGVASAAQGSLPGDPLYPVKVDVTEPLQVALAPTPAAKASLQAQQADARLQEAETLATQGRLSTSSQQQIVGLLGQQTAALNASLAQVSKASPQQASDISLDFQASMDAHAVVLQTIASSTVSDPIIAAAQASAQSVGGQQGYGQGRHDDGRSTHGAPVQPPVAFHGRTRPIAVAASSSSSPSLPSLATSTAPAPDMLTMFKRHRDMVQSLIADASTSAQDLNDGTDTTPLERTIANGTHRALDQAEQALQQADQQNSAGDQGDADASLLDSQTSATEASIFGDIGARFGQHPGGSGGQDGGHH